MCRAPCGPDKVFPDVRGERASKNTTRPCRHKARGCTFKGDRVAVAKHEPGCGHVPPMDLAKKNAELEQRITQLTLAQQNLLVERDALKSENAALKTEKSTLSITNTKNVTAATAQEEMRKKVLAVLFLQPTATLNALLVATARGTVGWKLKRSDLADGVNSGYSRANRWYGVEVKEQNYNVSFFFTKAKDLDVPDLSTIARFVHPTESDKDLTFSSACYAPQDAKRWGWCNAMTSVKLDEFCVDGHIVVSIT